VARSVATLEVRRMLCRAKIPIGSKIKYINRGVEFDLYSRKAGYVLRLLILPSLLGCVAASMERLAAGNNSAFLSSSIPIRGQSRNQICYPRRAVNGPDSASNSRRGQPASLMRCLEPRAGLCDSERSALSDRQCIFVVDDEKIIAETIAMILRWQGFIVESFTDPIEALATSHKQTPDLLVTDVGMQLLSGVELAIQVLKGCPNCKVLLLTGQPETDEMREILSAGGQEFDLLLKPIHPTELVSRVNWKLEPDCVQTD
jgi:CheY-like chemotaxis protein